MKRFAGRLIIVTLSCLAWLYLPSACAASTAASAQGALYRVTDGTRSLYLFGTIHVGRPDFYPLEPRIVNALAAAPVLALELDPGRTDAMASALQQYALLPAGQQFSDVLPPALAQRAAQALRRSGASPESAQRLRPWMLALTLTVQAYQAAGFQPALAVDTHLAEIVRGHGRPVLELESADQQLRLLSQLDEDGQRRFLAATLDDLEDARADRKLQALVAAWRHADQPALQRALDEMRQDGSFADRYALKVLLEGRNPGLADGIAGLLAQYDNAVAAVGILHLIGPHSVVALLRQRGLAVQRIY